VGESKRKRVLIADDEDVIRMLLKRRLAKEGYDILLARNGAEAIAHLEEAFCHVVVTDLKMPGVGGMEVLKTAKELRPDCEVLIMTAYASTETAIGAVREGAFDYLTKPFEHVDEVVYKIRQALSHQALVFENRALMKKLAELNKGLKRVVITRTRELNQANDDLLAMRGIVARHARRQGALPARILEGLETICRLAGELEGDESERVCEVGQSLRQEAESLSDLAATVLTESVPG